MICYLTNGFSIYGSEVGRQVYRSIFTSTYSDCHLYVDLVLWLLNLDRWGKEMRRRKPRMFLGIVGVYQFVPGRFF